MEVRGAQCCFESHQLLLHENKTETLFKTSPSALNRRFKILNSLKANYNTFHSWVNYHFMWLKYAWMLFDQITEYQIKRHFIKRSLLGLKSKHVHVYFSYFPVKISKNSLKMHLKTHLPQMQLRTVKRVPKTCFYSMCL